MNKNVLVVMGSQTRENAFGVTSGKRVAAALRRHGWKVETCLASDGGEMLARFINRPPDLVVPVGFGAPTEDGQVSAAARLVGIPCAGPTPASGGLMQDKSTFSRLVDAVFQQEPGVRSPRGFALTEATSLDVARARARELRAPLIVKPAWSGSSDHLFVCDSAWEAIEVAGTMLPEEGKVLVQELERAIVAEISCTIVDVQRGPIFLPIVELRRDDVAVLGAEEKFGISAIDRHIIPCRLSQQQVARVERIVLRLHEATGAIGLTRYDILVCADDEMVILEANAIPGLLESSIACDAARAAGIGFDELAILFAESAFLMRAEPRLWGAK